MSVVNKLVTETDYFPHSDLKQGVAVDWSQGVTPATVKQTVKNILSADFQLVEPREIEPTGVAVYDELSKILPFNANTAFFWRTTLYPTASFLDASGYPVADQASFLVFFYARTLGFMGQADKPQSILTLDGSPIEISWVFPTKTPPKAGEPPKQLAFIMEPLHPKSGLQLRGSDILDYLSSPQGSLGLVDLREGSMQWRKEIENFLFSHLPTDRIPDNSRFYIGFYLLPGGTVSLKTYFLLPNRIPTAAPNMKLYRKERDYAPIRDLIPRLDASLMKPFNLITDYFDSLKHEEIPTLLSLVTDVVPIKDNRLKFYCHTVDGLSLAHVERFLTLGGRLDSPELLNGLSALSQLWFTIFPEANESKSFDISKLLHRNAREIGSQHRIGGLLYYVEMKNGQDEPVTKIYIPIRNYLPNDATVAQRLEEFCDKVGYQNPGNNSSKGWFEKDFAKAFNHRPLDSMSGCCIHISFALKRSGWEVGHYYSSENWVHLQNGEKLLQ